MKVYILKVLSDIGCVGLELELRGQEGKVAPLTRTTNCGGCEGAGSHSLCYIVISWSTTLPTDAALDVGCWVEGKGN